MAGVAREKTPAWKVGWLVIGFGVFIRKRDRDSISNTYNVFTLLPRSFASRIRRIYKGPLRLHILYGSQEDGGITTLLTLPVCCATKCFTSTSSRAVSRAPFVSCTAASQSQHHRTPFANSQSGGCREKEGGGEEGRGNWGCETNFTLPSLPLSIPSSSLLSFLSHLHHSVSRPPAAANPSTARRKEDCTCVHNSGAGSRQGVWGLEREGGGVTGGRDREAELHCSSTGAG